MQKFIKDILASIAIGTVIFFVIHIVLFSTGALNGDFTPANVWKEYYENMIMSMLIYLANIYAWRFFRFKYGNLLNSGKNLFFGFLLNLTASFAAIFVSKIILQVVIARIPFVEFISNHQFNSYLIPMFIAVVIILAFYAFYFYKHWQENRVKEQKIIAGTASAKFDALKNQLDPHFLFNSLNVLTSLIEEDPNQAQKFTTSLSKVYRYVLEQKNKDLISVDEEFRFARTYVRLLKMRFEDSIVFDIPEKSTNPEAKIVPLSLQLLLENAVKHNVVTSDRPLHISVYEEDNMLVVRNNLQEKQVVRKSSGVGLQNIKQRYEILTERKVLIQKGDVNFSVQLPMLTKQVSVMEKQRVYIDDKYYKKAKEKVEKIKKFYGNLLSYCIIIPFLAFLNYQSTGFPWVLFPMVGWGIGVIAHGMEAYGYNPLWGKGWEDRRIKKYMDDDRF
ncbi:2TM domain-containing protein [Aurantibacter crassamenti]|uniref:2TM domain-containing protein n=1 Tax=Aurantibacter crassamenti TaxID=1837375 RepID=UPI00193A7BB9|nr:2TM domain-containing protein [Aurantibacter crassamenti]MBM1107658.1 2TM domain-containing protein [Aurantibacter crassamenti]